MIPRGNRAPLVLAFLVAMPSPAAGDDLAVADAGPFAPEALVEALGLRVHGTVAYRPGTAAADGVWTLELADGEGGTELTLRSPDGRSWSRISSLAGLDDEDRVRQAALQVGYLALLAGAPFAVDDMPPPPAAAPRPGAREVGLLFELSLGGAGDLWGQGSGPNEATELTGRVGFAWPWGLWVSLEGGWQRIAAAGTADLALHWAPLRAGIGGLLSWTPWELRFAVQALAEYWRAAGGSRNPEGWRGGAGLLVGGAFRLTPWCLVGIEAGMEFSPRAVQIDAGNTPLAASGQLRWRAAAVVGFQLAAL
jgi:hypothetical protein